MAGHAGAYDDNDNDNDDADDDNDQCRSCRGCAVKFVTQHRKCWSCGAANFKTSSLLNDQVRLNRFCTTVLYSVRVEDKVICTPIFYAILTFSVHLYCIIVITVSIHLYYTTYTELYF